MINFQFHPTALKKYPQLTNRDMSDFVGFIPLMISTTSDMPMTEQLNNGYNHGGGWRPFTDFVVNDEDDTIKYPGDPAYLPIAYAEHPSGEKVYVYEHSWVRVRKLDGTDEISRMD